MLASRYYAGDTHTHSIKTWTSLVAQTLRSVPGMREALVQSLGQEDPLEKEMATHFKYSCLENPMDGGAWQATVYGVTKSQTGLSNFTSTCLPVGMMQDTHAHTHTRSIKTCP